MVTGRKKYDMNKRSSLEGKEGRRKLRNRGRKMAYRSGRGKRKRGWETKKT